MSQVRKLLLHCPQCKKKTSGRHCTSPTCDLERCQDCQLIVGLVGVRLLSYVMLEKTR